MNPIRVLLHLAHLTPRARLGLEGQAERTHTPINDLERNILDTTHDPNYTAARVRLEAEATHLLNEHGRTQQPAPARRTRRRNAA